MSRAAWCWWFWTEFKSRIKHTLRISPCHPCTGWHLRQVNSARGKFGLFALNRTCRPSAPRLAFSSELRWRQWMCQMAAYNWKIKQKTKTRNQPRKECTLVVSMSAPSKRGFCSKSSLGLSFFALQQSWYTFWGYTGSRRSNRRFESCTGESHLNGPE